MKIKRIIKVSLSIGLLLTLTSPLWFAKSVQDYFPDEQQLYDYQWEIYGGWFRNIYYHEAWPELNIDAEWKLVPMGILCSFLMWSFIVFVCVFNYHAFSRFFKKEALHPAAESLKNE